MSMNPRKQTLILGGDIVVSNSLNASYDYLHVTHFIHNRAHQNSLLVAMKLQSLRNQALNDGSQ